MSLPVLVAIVVVGIALSVAAVHLTGGSRMAMLDNADQALSRFADDFPDEAAKLVHLTEDRRSAFLELGSGRVGIVHSVGDCFLTRIVCARDVRAWDTDANAVSLQLADFTWRGGRFAFANAAAARAVATALELGNPGQAREAA